MNIINEKKLLSLIKNGENINVDFKAILFAQDGKPRITQHQELVKDLAAFANTDGGFLVIGVGDGGEIIGFQTNDPMEQKIINICRDMSSPPLRPILHKVRTSGKEVLVIEIEKGSSDLCLVKGRIYIRVHNEVRLASSSEITDLILQRNHARMKELLQEKDSLSNLIIKVSNLSAHLFKTNSLINEVQFHNYCHGQVDLKGVKGIDVEKLVLECEKLLTNLDSVEINNLPEFIGRVNDYIHKLTFINEVLEETLDGYYCKMD